eukprot:14536486-Alexandrium_andersonii.AAC.1
MPHAYLRSLHDRSPTMQSTTRFNARQCCHPPQSAICPSETKHAPSIPILNCAGPRNNVDIGP